MCLEDLDGSASAGSNTNVLDLDTQVLLDELDVFLTVFWQLGKRGDLRDVSLPSWEGLVFDLDLCQSV